jgi:hypothetical protein
MWIRLPNGADCLEGLTLGNMLIVKSTEKITSICGFSRRTLYNKTKNLRSGK